MARPYKAGLLVLVANCRCQLFLNNLLYVCLTFCQRDSKSQPVEIKSRISVKYLNVNSLKYSKHLFLYRLLRFKYFKGTTLMFLSKLDVCSLALFLHVRRVKSV